MNWMLGVSVSVVAAVLIWLFVRGELNRRRDWFLAARAALGAAFGPFESVPSTDRQASRGQLDGAEAVFAADATTTEARLEVPLREGVERGRVFDLVVREEGGALEAGAGLLVGWDDEHGRLVFRARALKDAAATVKLLTSEARSFQEKLPALLDERAKAKSERASQTFGELTGPGGRHKLLGVALALSPDEWELVSVRPEGIEWERVPPEEGDAFPVELRLYAVAPAKALEDEEPRLRLIERIAGAFVDRLPDGSFEGATPEPHAASAPPFAGAPCATVAVDHRREVVVREDESAPLPYRVVFQAIFQPWAVSVFELIAPRAEADALLARALSGATFEKPPAEKP